MNAHSTIAFSRAATTTTTPHPHPSMLSSNHHITLGELEAPWQLNNNSEVTYNIISGNNNSSYGIASHHGLMQRSVSNPPLRLQHHTSFSFFLELLNSDDGPVRRVHSTGDLHRFNGKQRNRHSDSKVSSECSMIIEGMSKACRYSPEEKKVRIERYRSKRNQRNFNKKIKYASRKTLADSRPRIKGRFARNEEIDKNPDLVQWSHIGGDEEDHGEEDENWVSMFDSFIASNLAQESQATSSFGLLY